MEIIHKTKVTASCGCTSCVNLKYPQVHTQYQGKLIYFCNDKCLEKFNKHPTAFLASSHFRIDFSELDSVVKRFEVNIASDEIEAVEEHKEFLKHI